jgi:hypothetical protein
MFKAAVSIWRKVAPLPGTAMKGFVSKAALSKCISYFAA